MAQITKSDMKYFRLAKKEAEKSTYSGTSVGCVLVYHHKVIGAGHNEDKTSPRQKYYNRYRKFNNTGGPVLNKNHAEISALASVSYPVDVQTDWSKVSAYIYRIAPGLKNGLGMARPCPSCIRCLTDKGIHSFYYSTDYGGYALERI